MNGLSRRQRLFLASLLLVVLFAATFGYYRFRQQRLACPPPVVQSSSTQLVSQKQAGSRGTGRVAVSTSNPHYFQDERGHPLFLVGPYTFWGSLDLLRGKSNYYRLVVDGMDLPLHWRRHNPWPRVQGSGLTAGGIEGKFDLTRFDHRYFTELQTFIADAQAHGIYVHVSLFNEIFVKRKPTCCGFGRHPFGNGNHVNVALIGHVDRNNDLSGKRSNEFYDADALWGRTTDPQRLAVAELQKRYVEKVLLETRDFSNVFYEIGNEISASHDWIAYWVQFIRARADNPISVDDTHDKGFHPLTNSAFPVDAATYHTGDVAGDQIRRSIPAGAYRYNKILGNDTDGVGRAINRNAEQNRKGAWLTFVSGGGMWGDYIDGWPISDLGEEVSYFGYLLYFLRTSRLKYWEMAPCHTLTDKGKVLAKAGAEYLVYSTTGGTFTLDLGKAPGTLHYEWYNPRTGEFTVASTISGNAARPFTTPDEQDWVLHISHTPLPVRSTPRYKPTVTDAVLFFDNFEDGNSGGWVPRGGSWEVCQPPTFSKMNCKTSTDEALSLAGSVTWEDYMVQGTVFMADERGGAGLLGRVQSASQYYQLELSKDSVTGVKKWWLSKNDNGEWTHIASGPYDFMAKAFYLLRLDMRGSVLTASVAAEAGSSNSFIVLGSGIDTRFGAGQIGVRSWGSTASFDEIKVIKSEAPEP